MASLVTLLPSRTVASSARGAPEEMPYRPHRDRRPRAQARERIVAAHSSQHDPIRRANARPAPTTATQSRAPTIRDVCAADRRRTKYECNELNRLGERRRTYVSCRTTHLRPFPVQPLVLLLDAFCFRSGRSLWDRVGDCAPSPRCHDRRTGGTPCCPAERTKSRSRAVGASAQAQGVQELAHPPFVRLSVRGEISQAHKSD
jgi:hypothetical protein